MQVKGIPHKVSDSTKSLNISRLNCVKENNFLYNEHNFNCNFNQKKEKSTFIFISPTCNEQSENVSLTPLLQSKYINTNRKNNY